MDGLEVVLSRKHQALLSRVREMSVKGDSQLSGLTEHVNYGPIC